MKYSIVFIYATTLAAFKKASGLVKNTSGGQILSSGGGNNENVCEIQKMAEEMIEKKLNEKDLFTDIMDTLQNRLNDISLCVNDSVNGICIVEKDQKPINFQCTSEKYEKLIDKFTNKKLCHSKIAFNNTLLSAFIDKNDNKNAFVEIFKNLDIASQCIDEELKEIYASTVQLLKELRDSVITLSEKLWSNKMIEVLKKREEIIAGIFCELRNGSESKIIQNGMTIENVGIIKINDASFLYEAVQAFSEYYAYFPYFAQELLLKEGLVDRLIEIHEKLTSYRAKHLVSRLNENSKDEVINNEGMLNSLKNYKHFGSSNQNSHKTFVQINEMEEPIKKDDESKENSQNTQKDVEQIEKVVKDHSNNSDKKEEAPTETNNSKDSEIPVKPNVEKETEVNNPLFSIDETKPRNVKEYIKELLIDLDIIKFENGEPTKYLNDEGVKKEVEDSFISLESSTMLVRLFVKLQAVVLSIVQSFIIMTPSPTKDVKTYCKKAIVNGALVDHILGANENEEEELVHTFASKYNLLYEKIKLNELKKIEEQSRRNVGNKNRLSALQVNIGSNVTPVVALVDNTDKDDNNNNNKTPVIAVVSDPNGKPTEEIIKENVNLSALSTPVNATYEDPSGGSLYTTLSSLFIICFFLFCHI